MTTKGRVIELRAEKLASPSLPDAIFAALRDDLAAGVYAPGAKVTISEVSARFGVSITPVREAIGRLIAAGGLEYRRNHSAVVPDLDPPRIKEIALIRSHLEGEMAARAALRASKDDVHALEVIQDEEDVARADRDYAGVLRANQRFHVAIAALADMPISAGIVSDLWTRSGPMLAAISRPVMFDTLPDALPHRSLIAAFANGDADAARKAMTDDVERGTGLALEQMVQGQKAILRRNAR